MLRVVKELFLMQWRTFSREPGVLFWSLAFPILLTGLLGMAFKKKGDQPLFVVLVAEDAQERQAIESLTAGLPGGALLKTSVASEADARLALKRGRDVVAVFHAWDRASRRYLFDPANSEGELAMRRCKAWFSGDKEGSDLLVLDAKGSRYVDFVLPGLFASSVINSCLWGVGWMLIDYREKKFLRRMVATPMKKRHFFLALMLGRLAFMTVEFSTLFGFATWYFQVQVQGPWLAFAAVMLSGMLAFFGLASLIASRTTSPQVGIGLINAVTLPMFVVSGMFFSYERFPAVVQPVLSHFPPTMMVDALRAVMNEGAGLSQAAPACLGLSIMGLLCMALASRIFRWH
jgi:ABC-2 type transport system permease protein